MPRFKVVLIEHGYATTTYEREIIEKSGGEFVDADSLPQEDALQLCEDADGVMLRRIQVTAEILARFKRCKIVLRYGVGTDNVDIGAATELGIIVGHVPNYCMDEVSSHAIGLLLACVRRIVATHQKMEHGAWDVHRVERIWRMAGKTLGIVGLGNIGRAVAKKMAGWNLDLLGCDPFVDPAEALKLGVRLVDLETLCRESDYVSLHAPLLPETHHLVNERTLAWFKPSVVLINTARGPVVDTVALLQAVEEGRIAQAALDVFEQEPLPKDSPLRRHPRIIVTDHTAWYSEDSQIELQKTAATEVAATCSGGLPRFVANMEVLKKIGRWQEWNPSDHAKWQLKRNESLKPSRIER
jgi:D-3-phosphoglycerate dehydrogenase